MPRVKHYGCFEFKSDTSEETITSCFAAMDSMVGKIPGLLDFHHGPFESPEARDAYLPHPLHEEVKDIVVPNLERVVVFDFNLPDEPGTR